MKVADAVREYVAYKQSLGMSYKGRALKLNAFARFVGPIELDKVTPEMARNFLDGHGPVTTEWFNKFWVLNTFFRFAIARGWLLAMLALTIERLYRLRYLHRGKHLVPSSVQLLLHLWLGLSCPRTTNSS